MHVSEIKLWNFRKYGKESWDLQDPHLIVPLHSGLNVLIGENDAGKTAIIDAVKLVLKTHAYEWIKVEEDDFHTGDKPHDFRNGNQKLRIELILRDFTVDEGKNFVEWMGWEGVGKDATAILRLILQAERTADRILPSDVRAGMDSIGSQLDAAAREYLKATYLRPLRDAEGDLIPKRNSRISQVLRRHEHFAKGGQDHLLIKAFKDLNEKIESYFRDTAGGKDEIKEPIDHFLRKFIDEGSQSNFQTNKRVEFGDILEKLELQVLNNKNPGLGTLNRLYMAFELLHLQKKGWSGLRLGLIEELEAHLHPQAQMKVIEALQDLVSVSENSAASSEKSIGQTSSVNAGETKPQLQLLLSTHSPNLASKVKLKNLILCQDDQVYPLRTGHTKLDEGDEKFLEHFLDVTKANLFFARGVIIVEGWAEELLIPVIAEKIGCNLTRCEVSIVNVGSTAYKRYKDIFLRRKGAAIGIKVAVIADLDVKPGKDGKFNEDMEGAKRVKLEGKEQNVQVFVGKQWTLEWCLYKSKLGKMFIDSVNEVHPEGYSSNFEECLAQALEKKKTLKKREVADILAQKIKALAEIDQKDEYLEYLFRAIRHACRNEHEPNEQN